MKYKVRYALTNFISYGNFTAPTYFVCRISIKHDQTASEAHQASYPMGTGDS